MDYDCHMKLACLHFMQRRLAKALPLLVVFCLLANGAWGTDSIWKNTEQVIWTGAGASGNTVPYPPNIDATNFYNSGTIELLAYPPPFMTQHTLNYTNTSSGFMLGEVGWRFDYGPLPLGGRGMAANFVNNGTIESLSGGLPNPIAESSWYTYPQGYLWVSATNIVNKNGTLAADADCEIALTGTNVNLNRSTVEIAPISGTGSIDTGTNFAPDVSIYDQYWGTNNINNMDSSAIWNGSVAATAPFDATEPCEVTLFGDQFGFGPSVADSITNAFYAIVITTNIIGYPTNVIPTNVVVILATNIFQQAAFVYTSDPNIVGTIGFTPGLNPTNLFETTSVQLESLASGDTVYVLDTFGSDTSIRALLPNNFVNPYAACSGTTYRPTNYVVERVDFNSLGSSGLGIPPANFFYDTSWSNLLVNATYADYSAIIDNQASEPPDNPGPTSYASVTNLPGRIHIYADSLNLSNAQVRAEGEVIIQANHLVSSQNALMDCENLSYNLGSFTNGTVTVTNLALPVVTRLNGTVSAWSAVWTNYAVVILTNYSLVVSNITSGTNTTTTTNWVYSPLTNTIQINLYALLVDGSALSSTKPVTVYDLVLHGTNMVINDSMSVIQTFLLDGQSFTLNGSLTFPGVAPINPVTGASFAAQPIQNWFYSLAPTLRYFTNNGSLSIPNEAHFGDDGPTNYAVFVNTGTIDAYVQTINSDYFENDGNLSTVGGFISGGVYVTASSGKLQNGKISAGSDIQFFANDLKLTQSSVQTTSGELDLYVTNSLSDAGGGSGNTLASGYGFDLWLKPPLGDLLGSAFTTVVPAGDQVVHNWAANDYGPVNAGYTNNVALGKLVLSPQSLASGPIFEFSGTTSSNGLYVDLLDLSQLSTNFASVIQIDPNLVIYYAAAKLGFTPPPAGAGLPPQEPEEYLNGQFGGHLRWVTFAGPNSSVAVVINSQTYEVNKALRFATTIDSNGNGIPNYADPNPFNTPPSGAYPLVVIEPVVLTASLVPQPVGQSSPQISWQAMPGVTYQVQFSTNFPPVNWQPLLSYTSTAPTNTVVKVLDTNAPASGSRRYYRVSYSP